MREILFRGKRTDNHQWVEGYYVCDRNTENKNQYIVNEKGIYRVAHKTIGQYTGLKDMNGNRIFEEDIVVFNRKRKLPGHKCFPEVIKYHQGDCAYQIYPWGSCIKIAGGGALIQPDMMPECEKIGNIYDNPELLVLDGWLLYLKEEKNEYQKTSQRSELRSNDSP